MANLFLTGCIVSLLCCGWFVKVISRANFEITRYELCSEENVIKFHGGVTKRRGKHYLHFNTTSPFPLGDNVGVNCSIQTTIDGERFVTMHTIHEKDICKAANLYLGPYWHDITKAVNIPPRTCPIPAGNYHASNVYLNFDRLTLQSFPFGKLRIITNLVNSSNPSDSYLCMLEEVKNK